MTPGRGVVTMFKYKRIAERKQPLCSDTLRLRFLESFFILSRQWPQIVYTTDDKPVWFISHDNLKETLNEDWDVLLINPDTDEILAHIKSLLKVSEAGLSYKCNEQTLLLWLPDPTPPSTLSGSDPKSDYIAESQVECKLLWKNNGPWRHENTRWETYSSRSPGTA